MKCEECRWFVLAEESRQEDDRLHGACRRYPPVLDAEGEQDAEKEHPCWWAWPEVWADDFCGEFLQAEDSSPHVFEREDVAVLGSDLSIRAQNVLIANSLMTLSDVKKMDKLDLLRMRNIGRKSIKEIEAWIASFDKE